MKIIYSALHSQHIGAKELYPGGLIESYERPGRIDAIAATLRAAGLDDFDEPQPFSLAPITAVHQRAYVEFLRGAWAEVSRLPDVADAGMALPTAWPRNPVTRPDGHHGIKARLGQYAGDASSAITPGTWDAAIVAAHTALTAQDLMIGGETTAFALTRPPGHHAGSDSFAGYCYLNNAAIAAQRFSDAGARVAILDVDYHHGQGTQEIFYDRNDVMYVSLHANPLQEYPWYYGFSSETGRGVGEGYTVNIPLSHGCTWLTYLEALARGSQRIRQFGAEVLVVSLGVDTYEGEPFCDFRIKTEEFKRLGEAIGLLKLPTLFVMEGGYNLEAIGRNVLNVLTGFMEREG